MTQRAECLQKVEQLLKRFEWSKDYSRKFTDFSEAMSILEDNLSNESVSAEDKEWIRNTKFAYTRILLSRLPEIPQKECEKFLFLLLAFDREDLERIIHIDPALNDKFCALLGHFSEELICTLREIDRRYNLRGIEI